jgi:hypothetical protein
LKQFALGFEDVSPSLRLASTMLHYSAADGGWDLVKSNLTQSLCNFVRVLKGLQRRRRPFGTRMKLQRDFVKLELSKGWKVGELASGLWLISQISLVGST